MSGIQGERENISTDVLIIGFGFAGAVAAIEAADCGARVVIAEKLSDGGGNSILSAGNFAVVRPGAAAQFSSYLQRLSMGMTPPEVFDAYAAGSEQLEIWLRHLGGKAVPRISALSGTYPGIVEGAAFPRVAPKEDTFDIRVAEGDLGAPPAMRLWHLLSKNIKSRKIEVIRNARAKELLLEKRRVVGAVLDLDGQMVLARASTGVVLACGGFENDPGLLIDFVPSKPIMFAGSPGNTGDGVRMAQRAGAALWHMAQTATLIGYKAPDYPAAFCIFFKGPGFIYVDQNAKRYIDETTIELHDFDRVFSYFDPVELVYPRNPSWAIFNKATLDAGALTWKIAGYNRDSYSWSADNRKEVRHGWIVESSTIEDLAQNTGLPQDTLQRTIDEYNRACSQGDASFGRGPRTMERLDEPYYAIQLRPVLVNTQGGPRRDDKARILNVDGAPIEGLYGAGELGSIWGPLYDGAGNVTECLVYGRIAGAGAAGDRGRNSDKAEYADASA